MPASDTSATPTAQTTTSSKSGGLGASPRIDDVRLTTTVGLGISRTARVAGERLDAVRGSRTVSARGRMTNRSGGSRIMASPSMPISTRSTGTHFELRRRPLTPRGKALDFPGDLQRSEPFGVGRRLDPSVDDPQRAAVEMLASAAAAQLGQLVRVIGHQEQLGAGCFLAGRHCEAQVEWRRRRPRRSGSMAAAVCTLAFR